MSAHVKNNRMIVRMGRNASQTFCMILLLLGIGFAIVDSAAFGGTLALIGLVGGGARRCFVLDRLAQTAGLSWPFYQWPVVTMKRWSLSEFNAIRLGEDYSEKDSEGDPIRRFVVYLGGSAPVRIAAGLDYLDTRKTAEQIAIFLRMPLKDKVSGVVTTRRPDELQLSLKQRLQDAPRLEIPQEPHHECVLSIAHDGEVTSVVLCAQPLTWKILYAAIAACGFIFAIIFFFDNDAADRWIVGLCFALLLVCLFVLCAFSRYPLVIQISPTFVRYRKSRFFAKSVAIADLKECVLGTRELHLLSEQKWMVMPFEFKNQGKRSVGLYLRDLILYRAMGYS